MVDALEQAAKKDPSSASWVIGLDGHYQKVDACEKITHTKRKKLG